MKYAMYTLGCKVNQYESDAMSDIMLSFGCTPTEAGGIPDIAIINSCSVTEHSDKKACQLVSKLKRMNGDMTVVLCGCFPQAFPDAAAETGADIIFGTGGKKKLAERLERYFSDGRRIVDTSAPDSVYEELGAPCEDGRTRAFVKIEDGCDCFCSYCIIPYARGRVRSRSLADIKKEVKKQSEAGHKEIVLVGINLSCYGKDIGLRLADAVEAVCENPLVERVRLSSLEPELLTDDDISRLAAQEKFCPHFHLSLQSGCNATLKRMNRHYTAEEYAELVGKLRSVFPGCAVTTDIMVGFCGETDEEFAESMEFAEKIGFAKMHVFTYSVRSGTAAARRTDHVAEQVKAERYRKMSALDERMSQSFLESRVGRQTEVLIQKRTSPDFAKGLAPDYTEVKIYDSSAKKHDIIRVKIVGVEKGLCIGEEL